MKSIGIDIGTTTISGVVFDSDIGSVVKAATVSGPGFEPSGYPWEKIQSPEKILKIATDLLNSFLDEYPDTAAIGLTGQMHGIVYTNDEGKAVSPLYTWQDQRGVVKGSGNLSVVEELAASGIPAFSGYGLITHIYNVKNNLVPAQARKICTIADYLGMALAGRCCPLIHRQMAASLGLYDASAFRFCEKALTDAGVDLSILPEVTGDIEVLGTYRGVPVTVALGDNQAAFYGSVGACDNTALVNMGTGGQISILSHSYFTAPGIEARPFLGDSYLLSGSCLCGGRAYAIFEKFIRNVLTYSGQDDKPCYELLGALAQEGKKLSSVPDVKTTFSGTRINPDEKGQINNLTEENFNPAALCYGLLTGMARELFDFYKLIEGGTGIKAESLIASGNGLRRNPVLCDVFSEMFNAPLKLSEYEEEAAVGAAKSAADKA